MNFSSPQRLFSNSFFQELVELRAIKLPLCFSVLAKDLYDSMINAHHYRHSFVNFILKSNFRFCLGGFMVHGWAAVCSAGIGGGAVETSLDLSRFLSRGGEISQTWD